MMKSNNLAVCFWGSLLVAPFIIYTADTGIEPSTKKTQSQSDARVQIQQALGDAKNAGEQRISSSSDDDYSCPITEEGLWFLIFAGLAFATERGKS